MFLKASHVQAGKIEKCSKLLFGMSMLILTACQQAPDKFATRYPETKKQTSIKPVRVIPPKPQIIHFNKIIPESYQNWLRQGDHRAQVLAYQNYLTQRGVGGLVPNHELLRSARDWQKCNDEEYRVPPRELWGNLVPTLNILKQMLEKKVLTNFEVTSVYRSASLNKCAGGADNSRHIFNTAMDFRIGPEFPDENDLIQISQSKQRLCQFWTQYGESLNMGLGVYKSGQIHIDSLGYRTWGANHRSQTSFCSTF
nr:D-Ala-D-Ala carboxypeptidase family metallohydrolase [Acinetobacter sp. Marseille-Q1620]